ncbi:MAG: DUF2975 domain-containing protein [Culicoidibacterales bacterium]
MWNKNQSLILSKILTMLFGAVLLIILFFAPTIITMIHYRSTSIVEWMYPYFLGTIYSGGIVALILLSLLAKLLDNIGKGKVFIHQNITCLRWISWLCIMGAIITVVSAAYWIIWLLIAIIAAFFALIIRVIKNIMLEATLIKQENDYTI